MISWNCNGCSKPLLSNSTTNKTNAWMHHAVLVYQDGYVFQGAYDGEMIIGCEDMPSEPCVWHKACWIINGMPKKYEASVVADDTTGYYIDGKDNDFWTEKEPRKT